MEITNQLKNKVKYLSDQLDNIQNSKNLELNLARDETQRLKDELKDQLKVKSKSNRTTPKAGQEFKFDEQKSNQQYNLINIKYQDLQ